MTEKRFRAVVCVTDWYIEDKLISPFAVLTPHQASDLLNEQHETIERLKQNIDELLQLDVEEDLLKENEELKSFIKSLASPDGRIWLSSGYGYRIDKILNDFKNTENDDGDVE